MDDQFYWDELSRNYTIEKNEMFLAISHTWLESPIIGERVEPEVRARPCPENDMAATLRASQEQLQGDRQPSREGLGEIGLSRGFFFLMIN